MFILQAAQIGFWTRNKNLIETASSKNGMTKERYVGKKNLVQAIGMVLTVLI